MFEYDVFAGLDNFEHYLLCLSSSIYCADIEPTLIVNIHYTKKRHICLVVPSVSDNHPNFVVLMYIRYRMVLVDPGQFSEQDLSAPLTSIYMREQDALEEDR